MDIIEFSKYAEEHWEIDREVDRRILEKAKKMENVIIDSRLSGWLMHLNDIPAYKVYVDASLDVRIQRIWKREDGDIRKIKEKVIMREESEKKRYMEIYGIDFEDLSIYDKIIQSDSLSPEEIVQEIIGAIKYEEKH